MDDLSSQAVAPAPEPPSPRACPRCKLASPAGAGVCECGYDFQAVPRFGLNFAPLEAGAEFGTMKQRFLAYVADQIMIRALLVCVGIGIGLAGLASQITPGVDRALGLLATIVYMSISVAASGTTVGKYLIGLEVRSDRADTSKPTLRQVLVRESVGRLASLLLFGAGYWTAIGHPQKQAWSDRMADTLVTRRPTKQNVRIGLFALVLVALAFEVAVSAYGMLQQQRAQQQKEMAAAIETQGRRTQAAQSAVAEVVAREAGDVSALREKMAELVPKLDKFDAELLGMLALLKQSFAQNLVATHEEHQMELAQQFWTVRRQQSGKLRLQAKLVAEFEESGMRLPQLQRQLRMLDSDVAALDQQAIKLMEQIQAK